MAVLIANTQANSGMAWGYGSPNNPVAIVTKWGAEGMYILGHEVGHLYGANHDRVTDNAATKEGYNFGYRLPQTDKYTILA